MSQATLTHRPYVNSNLFSSHYLDERVKSRPEWDCDDEAKHALKALQGLYELESPVLSTYNEDTLIDNWIDEVLEIFGYGTQQQVALPDERGFVDELLFETPTVRREAATTYLRTQDTTELFRGGIGIVEAKQWDAAFDDRFSDQRPYRNASHQIKHYLENTPSDIQWAILTNGRKWRLYGTKDYETQTYYEVDLPELLENGDLEAFKYFYVFFRPAAFRGTGETTFLDEVWSESETASQELGESLQDNVFTALRVLGRGFVETNDDLEIAPDDEEALNELKEQSLVFLYRLMFILYAEARGLIHPESQSAQEEYDQNFSFDELRLDIHETIGEVDEGFGDEFSGYSTTIWNQLQDLFRLIDKGEKDLGIPPYNGGLFDQTEHEFLTEHEVTNQYLSEVIYRLSTTQNDEGRYVLADYADLDTRHLGSVYEGLLEHKFHIAPEQYIAVAEDGGQVWKPASEGSVEDAIEVVNEGGLYVVNDEGERKSTGAYYTPDYVVTYIVEETLGPLVENIRENLESRNIKPGNKKYVNLLLEKITNLRILDPAMGSGHFLTRATNYLTKQVIAEVRESEEESMWSFDEHRIRREIAKECIYGVDKNGMAVELAKLSMWLETLAADRPLAFLDHHIKHGNSLVGSDIEDIESIESNTNGDKDQYSLAEFGAIREGTIERLMDIYSDFLSIENETVRDVRNMESKYKEIEQDELRRRLISIANVHTAENFGLDVGDDGDRNVYEWMASSLEDAEEWNSLTNNEWFVDAQSMAVRRHFFHWKLEFPEVFYNPEGEISKEAGFDAVIGNPPYISNWNLREADKSLVPAIERMFPNITRSHWDIYVPFCKQAIRLLKPGGHHSFIVSNAIAAEKYSKNIRKEIIENYSLTKLVEFEEPVFKSVSREVLIYFMENRFGKNSSFNIYSYERGQFEKKRTLPQRQLAKFDDYAWRTDLGDEDLELKQKLESKSILLGELCWVNPGIVAHSGSHSSLDFDKDDIISTKPNDEFKKYVSGKNIDRHSITWNGKCIDYEKYEPHFHRSKTPLLFESEKIIFSGISSSNNRIKSAYDNFGYYTNHSANHATKWTEDTIKYRGPSDRQPINDAQQFDMRAVAGIINSKLLSYYFSKFLASKSLGNDTTSMYPEDIRKLPILDVREGLLDNEIKQYYSELSDLTSHIIDLNNKRQKLNLDLTDYLTSYGEGFKIGELSTPAEGVGNTKLTATKEDYHNLRVGDVTCVREDDFTVTIYASARYKPKDLDTHTIDQWGYTETRPIPAMRLSDLSVTEADLIEAFVPVAVDEAGGFAGFRETATKRNSLVDRLKAINLPNPGDVAEDLERYRESVERAEELDEKIQRTDDLIDETVYELYGLTDEEIEIIEATVDTD